MGFGTAGELVPKKGRKTKPKPLPIEIDDGEYVDIINNTKHMHHKVAFMLGWESGLRISEIVNLKKEDIDLAKKSIRINMGKNSKDRIVSLPKSFKPNHLQYIPLKCRQRALQKALISSAIKTGLKAKKPKVHFHSLRHGFATHCIRKSMKLSTVQMLMGHQDVQTTSIYINLAPQEALDEYEEKFN